MHRTALSLCIMAFLLGLPVVRAPVGRGLAVRIRPVATDAARSSDPVTWSVDNLVRIGGHQVSVAGSPRVVTTKVGAAVEFNGATDGLFLETHPLIGLGRFTVEVLFQPAADGPAEQRFLHFEETGSGNRALFETRSLPGESWCLDTFLRFGEASLTLIDRGLAHPVGRWHTAALTFDGETMAHYVDGVRELSGAVQFRPLGQGRTSIGVRQNRVSWFKGRIARIRVTPDVLLVDRLLKPPGPGSAD